MLSSYLRAHFKAHMVKIFSGRTSNEFMLHIPHDTIVSLLSKYVDDVKITDSVKNHTVSVSYTEDGEVHHCEYQTPMYVLEDILRLQNKKYPEDMYENGISTYNVVEVYGTMDASGGCFVIQDSELCTDKLSILYYTLCGISQEHIDASKPWVTYVADILPTFSYAMYISADRQWNVGKLVTGLEGKAVHPDESDEENADLSTGEYDEKFGPSGSAWKR